MASTVPTAGWRTPIFAAALAACQYGGAAQAQDEFVASLQLRGGYDSNPVFATGTGIGGSAFISAETALAAGGKVDDISFAVVAEGKAVHFSNRLMTPAMVGKVILKGTMGDDDLRLSTTTTIADTRSYNLRSSDLIQALRLDSKHDNVKLFVTGEFARSELNQTNAIFPDFFPAPHRFLRGTLIPGVSVAKGKAEVGVSVNMSIRRYAEEFDIFGYRRDNERIEPFVFVKYTSDEFTAFASVSRLMGRWHDPDFTNVDKTLFDVSLAWKPKPFSIDVAASRKATDTTFPISPITIDSVYMVKAGWQATEKWLLSASVGYAETEYLDSPFLARTMSYGIGAERDLGHGFKAGVDLTRLQGKLISGEPADAVVIAASLSKRFSPGSDTKEKPSISPKG